MGNPNYFIIIREYRQTDEPAIRQIMKNSLLSLVNDSFIASLFKEITFQLTISFAAVMFIFVGVPILYCISSIPLVIAITYFSVYLSHWFKAVELFQEKPYQCWVAEACEPFFSTRNPQNVSYSIITEQEIRDRNIDVGSLQRKVIGTVALKVHKFAENSLWLYRFGVQNKYRRKRIGTALFGSVKHWGRIRGYGNIEASITEHQEVARQFLTKTGCQLKQMYHKQLVGTAVTLLKYQFGFDLTTNL